MTNIISLAIKKSFKLYGTFSWIRFNCLNTAEPLRGDSLPSPKELLVPIWSTSEGWKTELTLELLSGLEPGTINNKKNISYFHIPQYLQYITKYSF